MNPDRKHQLEIYIAFEMAEREEQYYGVFDEMLYSAMKEI